MSVSSAATFIVRNDASVFNSLSSTSSLECVESDVHAHDGEGEWWRLLILLASLALAVLLLLRWWLVDGASWLAPALALLCTLVLAYRFAW